MLLEPLNRAVQRLGRLTVDGREASDADLLRRFAESRDEAAFAAIVRRHGPMVFGVCCRSLGHVQDAEDAFQATFLVLARKATSVRAETVGRWLYGVAVKVANKARIRRERRTFAAIELNQLAAPPEPPPADWLPLLDSALAKLPDRDRWPIVLCDLQGRSRAAVAAELGIAEGTLSSRLARAREKLRARLVRLGIAPGLAALTVGLAPKQVPAHLIETLATGATAAARQLAEGVLRAMVLTNVAKLAIVSLFAVGAIGLGFAQVPGADPKPGAKDAPKEAPPDKVAPRTPAKSDAERFRGTWVVESGRRDGNRNDKEGRELWIGDAMSFDGDRVKFALFPGRDKLYKLDPGWDQKRIDFEFRGVANGARTIAQHVPSIYRFEGEKLHIVLGVVNLDERPESFEHQSSGSPFTHIILRKAVSKELEQLTEEQRKLEGTWVMAAVEANGERKLVGGTNLTFKGSRFTLRPVGEGLSSEGEYTLDLASSPRHIDLKLVSTPTKEHNGTTMKGIYALKDGVLTLCLDEFSKGRPAGFNADGYRSMFFVHEGERTELPPAKLAATGRLRDLQKARVLALEAQMKGQFERVQIGKDPLITFIEAERELGEAELELADTTEAKHAVLEKMVKQFQEAETKVEELRAAGLQTTQGVAQIKAARLKAEIDLEKLKAAKSK